MMDITSKALKRCAHKKMLKRWARRVRESKTNGNKTKCILASFEEMDMASQRIKRRANGQVLRR
jgi:hypothetical protein